ncbi:unnamed protein product [Ilex paraguariensis]|uniref:Uncharacterized protein n=1 Tax=Ilex paraguariensis TaxID=185542 RepID=A0ABC8RIA9_9AQUA
MVMFHYLDTILVPLSLFITIGYHAYLWHIFKNKPSLTSIGMDFLVRRAWLQELNQANPDGDEKKGMLAVQSLRNSLMATILTASITILITVSLAALTNNVYNGNHLFSGTFFASHSSRITVLKYGCASLFLLASFLCSSVALGCLVDAIFLINALGEFSLSPEYAQMIFERGFMLATVGSRVLCLTFPLLLWTLGPVPVANKPSLTSIGMDFLVRRAWLQELNQANPDGDEKKGMLAVQSLRNSLMATILTASITILITVSLAALTNNVYNGNHLFSGTFFASHSSRITVLKYGCASLFLLASFLCSSVALGCLVDAIFLINALGEFSLSPEYAQMIFERGFMLATVGSRVLCLTFPLLLWTLGPVPVAVSSMALVWGLYGLDFAANFTETIKKSLT